ncbi:MAG TPA: anti-sigma factor [Steroidobacteraceae bacterium]|jgi:anti-sigma-K factor RskA
MKHDQPQLIDALASEYVLGTLRGAARRRFERWQSEEWHIASRVRTWEARLIPLALGLPPIAPSQELWQRIEARIRAADASRTDTPPRRAARPALRALAAVLVLCALFAGGYVAWRMTESLRLQTVATIKGAQGPLVWSIELDSRGERLRAVALPGAAAQPGHSFELWALPPGKGAPVSLGLLPDAGQLERTLTVAQRAALASATQVAVSLEPPGGSPTGAPTGPVLFVAALKRA